MACLDENAIAALLSRRLEGEARSEAERHLSTCEACRALVEETAFMFAGDAAAEEESAALTPGAKVGRYVILRFVGAGAFGVVYAAFDPELDRKIALKVLRSDRVGERWRERFLREARAMARLSHPNVAQIYDVRADGDRVSIAMEFVEGTNLAEWLEQPRSWREVLQVFVAAGRGLAAAHAAGLIHRDFKPGNVLISERGAQRAERSVVVSDFGLAQLEGESTGEVSGTPRYMAPEQHAGEASAASDQFSFAVALHEALFRDRHAKRDSVQQDVAQNKRTTERRNRERRMIRRFSDRLSDAADRDLGAPSWVTRAIDRALSLEPSRRHPSMDALLAELAVEPRDRRSRRLAWAGLALLIAVIPAARIYDVQRREARLCKGAPAKVEEVWNPRVQASLRSTFSATGRAHADESARKASLALDAWFSRWSSEFTDACEATRIRGEQSDRVLTERMLCLERARAEAAALLEELAGADATIVERAAESVDALTPFDECSDVASLLAPLAPPPRLKSAVVALQGALARARAIRNAGRLERAREESIRAAASAKELGHAPLIAEALLAVARVRAQSGEFEEAQASLRETIGYSARGHHDRVGAEAWIELVFLAGAVGDREEAALALEEAARAALARIGDHPRLSARLDSAIGLVLAARGRYAAAIERHRAALASWVRARGKHTLEAGLEHHRLAEVLLADGQLDEAEDHAARSQEILHDTYGAEHPILALPISVLAEVACERRDFAECGRRIERAIALRATPGTSLDHPTFIPKRLILIRALAGAGRTEEARRELRLVAQIPAPPLWQARVAMMEAELDDDVAAADRAVALMQANLRADHPDVAAALKLRSRFPLMKPR